MQDKRIDDYISKSEDFAQPILIHLRKLVHTACPMVEETIKWGFPIFEYKGILCNMAAFKQHCAFGFWKASLLKDGAMIKENKRSGMGSLGKIKRLDDLPPDSALIEWLNEAMILNENGIKLPEKKKNLKAKIIVPDILIKALGKNKKAGAAFNNFSPSHKREYIEWIVEAKTEATRDKRLATTIEWLTEGKSRMWKYVKK